MEDRKVPLVVYLDGVRTVIGEATIRGDGTFHAEINSDGLAGAIVKERYTEGDISLSFPGLYPAYISERKDYIRPMKKFMDDEEPRYEFSERIHSGSGKLIFSNKELPILCTCDFGGPCVKHPEVDLNVD